MKRIIVLIMLLCFISTSCAKRPADNIEVSIPVKTQSYIGRFQANVSIYRDFGDKLIIQKELEEGFELFSVDINEATLSFDYTVTPMDDQLYYKKLDASNILKVKQLGNSEENNVLVLEGKNTKVIAKHIGYSETALVSTSPSQKYIVYCTVGDMLNTYSLQLYNRETHKTLLLVDIVNEAVLNDMQGNVGWSPNERYIVVANKQIYNVTDGKLISDISAERVEWSTSDSKLAYIKSENGLGKSICILNLKTAATEEVFIANQGEYLPGYIVWNEDETKIAIVTALIDTAEDINPYKAIYSLDLPGKEAVRIDSALKLDVEQVSKLESMHYNASGNLLALTMVDNLGSYLYVYNMSTGEWQFFLNIEYLHYENNEAYICNAGNSLYFVLGQGIIELDEHMNFKQIHKSNEALEDIYISRDGSSMIIVEKLESKIILRQLKNFSNKSM